MKDVSIGLSFATTVLTILGAIPTQAVQNTPHSRFSPFGQNRLLLSQENSSGFEFENYEFWAEQCLILEQNGEYETALEACEKAITLEPRRDNYDIWSARSNILFQLQQYSEAIVSYNQLLRIEPQDSLASTRKCIAFLNLGNYESAVESCEEALRVNGDWGTGNPGLAWYNQGLAFKMLGRLQEAFISFERALSFDPEYHAAQAELLKLREELSLTPEENPRCENAVIRAYDQALQYNLNDWMLWKSQGIYFFECDNYEQALISFDQAIALVPDYSLALAYKCTIQNHLENYQEALETCQAALDGNQEWDKITPADTWYQTSLALLGLEQYSEAIAAAERTLSLQPEFPQAWNNIAVSSWHLEAYKDAEKASQEALDLNNNYAQAWFNRGRIFSSLGDYEQAISAYDKSLELEFIPGGFVCSQLIKELQQDIGVKVSSKQLICADILMNKAVAIWNQEGCLKTIDPNCNNALQPIENASEINPEFFDIWYNYGLIARKLEEYDKCLNAYQQADSLNPEQVTVITGQGICFAAKTRANEEARNEEARREQTTLKLEDFQFFLSQYNQALKIFDKALTLDPEYELAQQHKDLVMKDINRVIKEINKQTNPVNPENLF